MRADVVSVGTDRALVVRMILAFSRAATVVAVLACWGLPTRPAHAQSGTRTTPDGARTLISKDVGAERWAITYRLADGRVTGNVFRTDGDPPSKCSTSHNTVAPRCGASSVPSSKPAAWGQWEVVSGDRAD